ncbi:MAG: hypothetical protein M0P12_02455 [Paludibacteraceae bacterium]|nr:hypothetical protein [Paludibacteraceae bacterium]
MTRRFLFSACIALFSMCAISLSSCSSDDDDEPKEEPQVVYTKASLSFSVNQVAQKNGDIVMALNKASISNTNQNSEIVTLSFNAKQGTSAIKYVTVKYSNDYVSNVFVTDTDGYVWNGKDKGANVTNGEISFVGVYAKYTITVVDAMNIPSSITFELSGSDSKYSSVARLLSNKQVIKLSFDGKKYEKTQLGLSYSPETETTKGKFNTAGQLLKVDETLYNDYQAQDIISFKKDAEDSEYIEANKTINDSAPIFFLYKNKNGNYDQYYLLKVVSLDENTATIEVQY